MEADEHSLKLKQYLSDRQPANRTQNQFLDFYIVPELRKSENWDKMFDFVIPRNPRRRSEFRNRLKTSGYGIKAFNFNNIIEYMMTHYKTQYRRVRCIEDTKINAPIFNKIEFEFFVLTDYIRKTFPKRLVNTMQGVD